jgi:hypothetical protein
MPDIKNIFNTNALSIGDVITQLIEANKEIDQLKKENEFLKRNLAKVLDKQKKNNLK